VPEENNSAEEAEEEESLLQHNDVINARYKYSSVEYIGEIWNLEHLKPFAFKFELNVEVKVDVIVFFSCHCFTRKATDEEQKSLESKYWYSDTYEDRVLDPERYAFSRLLLPRLVQELKSRHIKSTGHGNFMTIEVIDTSSHKLPYVIFFEVLKDKKRKKRLLLIVQSAYVKNDQTNRMRSGAKVNFAVLLKATYEGRKIRP
jgi:hypothetical protein